jgi:hypothetical protein
MKTAGMRAPFRGTRLRILLERGIDLSVRTVTVLGRAAYCLSVWISMLTHELVAGMKAKRSR